MGGIDKAAFWQQGLKMTFVRLNYSCGSGNIREICVKNQIRKKKKTKKK